jgi:hypothetical protein
VEISEEIHYAYELVYPESMGSAVFYVGQGKGDRIDEHEREARKGCTCRKCSAIQSVWRRGEQIVKRKVFETPVKQDACIYEWVLINLIYGIDNLTNWWDGMQGAVIPKKKMVNFSFSREFVDALDRASMHTNSSRARYIRQAIDLHLTTKEAAVSLSKRRLAIATLSIGPRCGTVAGQFPLEHVSRLEMVPSGMRSAVIEYLLRSDPDIMRFLEIPRNSSANLLTIK